jgi:predicted short-subunit dehydrogenase-like oxidoreductase (DUF2520 family)
MSFLSWFGVVKQKVSAFFVTVFGADAAQKFAVGSVAVLKTAAGVLAMDAVQYASGLKLGSGAEARATAAAKLENDAKAQGISLTNSVINLLIELAVTALVKKNIIVE